jgi:hypothetical protein
MKSELRRSFGLLLKVTILIILLWVIYKHVFQEENLSDIWKGFRDAWYNGNRLFLFLAFLLMPINWFLEARKWQVLVAPLERVKSTDAFKAVFSGISVSLFTPNRIGEFAGRVLYLLPENKLRGIGLTLLGSLGQYAVTFGISIWGFYLFMTRFYASQWSYANLLPILAFVVPVLLLSLAKYINPLDSLSVKELGLVLIYSALRYLVFTTQYILLIRVFGIDITWVTGFILVSSIFFAQTVLPTLDFLGLLIKGELALFFLAYVTDLDLSVLAVAFAIWFINLLIPALLGSIFLWGVNLQTENNNEA